jgi:hypothetical protein
MNGFFSRSIVTFVDAHVHIYDCFDLPTFLDSAFSNFRKEANRIGRGNSFTTVLLLTETSRQKWFHRLRAYGEMESTNGGNTIGNWTFHHTDETCSLRACSNDRWTLYIIAGQQINTSEKLEILALGTTQRFEDGAPLETVIQRIRESGAIPVIPWGFGKWIGRRGGILKKLLKKTQITPLFLGDNGGRPLFWPRPLYFRKAQANGLRVLPGSDPLPLASESSRAGSFGFTFQGTVDPEHPALDIKKILLDPRTDLQPYGSLENPYRFVRNQLSIHFNRIRKHYKWA